jgi:outer membrane protein OmpA-like peptidoglycan-associated protein
MPDRSSTMNARFVFENLTAATPVSNRDVSPQPTRQRSPATAHARRVAAAGTLVLFTAAVHGCQAHGTLSARAETGGLSVSASGTASAAAAATATTAATPAETAKPPPVAAIRYDKARQQLDWEDILFPLDDATIDGPKNPDSERNAKVLTLLSELLRDRPSVKLRIEGHTDSRASNQYNLDLSDRRAAAVREWLVDPNKGGVAPDRLSSVGLGEREAKVPERLRDAQQWHVDNPAKKPGRAVVIPAEVPDIDCNNGPPGAPPACEELVWKFNRRVELHVTAGTEELEKEEEPLPAPVIVAPAPPPPSPPSPPAEPECPLLLGVAASALGPNAILGAAFAFQPPGVCWFEGQLGLGYNYGTVATARVTAEEHGVPILARGRFWFFDRHSLVLDAGVGTTVYDVEANGGDYSRVGALFLGSIGAGYGFRSDGPFRLAILAGAIVQAGSLPQGYRAGTIDRAERDQLDYLGDDTIGTGFMLWSPIAPYVEATASFLFE